MNRIDCIEKNKKKMNSYEKEVIENIKRHAKHGKTFIEKNAAIEVGNEVSKEALLDYFIAILDEISRIE